jgi:hypothetical protein
MSNKIILLIFPVLLSIFISCEDENNSLNFREVHFPCFKYDPGIGVVYLSIDSISYDKEFPIFQDTVDKKLISKAKISKDNISSSYEIIIENSNIQLHNDAFIEYNYEKSGLPLIKISKKYAKIIFTGVRYREIAFKE